MTGAVAARAEAFGGRHPRLYASRHVVVALAQTLGVLLGIGLLLRSLLPRIDWSWLPGVEVPTEWVPDLSWVPDPLGWLFQGLPDVDVPEWAQAVAQLWKWWGLVLIAVLVAVEEVQKRRRRQVEDVQAHRGDGTGDGDGTGTG